MEAVLLVGLQASGKSTFCKDRLFTSHLRINLDMLRTRARERQFMETCLRTRQPFVVDNTNPTRADRARYIDDAKKSGFRIVGYYFQSNIEDCQRRNERRPEDERVPTPGILGTYNRLELPTMDEGFDELYYVKTTADGRFAVEEWKDEV